jgi:hypothetical protein
MDSCKLYVPKKEDEQDRPEEFCQSQSSLDIHLLSPRHRIFLLAHVDLFTTTTGRTLARTIEVNRERSRHVGYLLYSCFDYCEHSQNLRILSLLLSDNLGTDYGPSSGLKDIEKRDLDCSLHTD